MSSARIFALIDAPCALSGRFSGWLKRKLMSGRREADPRFPHVFTTYRLTEIHCGGIPSRVMPHTAELQPEAFVEISPELAAEHGISSLDWTVLSTLRGEIEVRALVTERMRAFRLGDRTVHQIGMPWLYGHEGYATGDIANVLFAISGDPNVSIHTTKAITCNLRPGRLAHAGGTVLAR